ncbi:MAG: GNAT family N-acetyltransferase [Glaciecola sp.]
MSVKMEHQSSTVNAACITDYTPQTVANLYSAVFGDAPATTFFLSETWISTWLAHASVKPNLLVFSDVTSNRPLGFAFIGCTNNILGKHYYLNQTGHISDDQVWVEYNDVISLAHHKQCRKALLNYISKQAKCFKVSLTNTISEQWQSTSFNIWSKMSVGSYNLVLRADTPLHTLSKNTKNQVARARKYIEKHYGEITMHKVEDDTLQDDFDQLAHLHKYQWETHKDGSGFNNPQFVNFHLQLLKSHSESPTQAALYKFSARDHVLGYLYFFTYYKTVYFYLSAINYADRNNKYKPGMVMHTLAIHHFSQLGFTCYDFLAGEARYKASLSDTQSSMYFITLYRNIWYLLPIHTLVRVKRKVLHWRKRFFAA